MDNEPLKDREQAVAASLELRGTEEVAQGEKVALPGHQEGDGAAKG